MSSTPTFTSDVLISYHYLDNHPLDENEKGWIVNFHQQLERLLGESLGYQPTIILRNIWSDVRLRGDPGLKDKVNEQLRKTAVFIFILSPAYARSDWCLKELRKFCRLADKTGGLLVGDRMRVFKVAKTYVEFSQQPPELKSQLGYEFFEVDAVTGRPVAFEQVLGPNRDPRYWNLLNDLAYDVEKVLSEFKARSEAPAATSASPEPEKTTYPAQATDDLSIPTQKESEVPLAPKPHEVFISYSNKDTHIAGEVRDALEDAGIECWIAEDDLLPSEKYGQAIVKAINSSRLILLVFTANANVSEHVESEIDRAYNKKKPIILFRVEEIDLSESLEYYLSKGSWLNASVPPLDKHLPKLIEKVKRLLSVPPTAHNAVE